MNIKTLKKAVLNARCRWAAGWQLLDHYRFRCALSTQLQAQYREEAFPWVRATLPVLPLLFGRRHSRTDQIRRRMAHLRRRLA